MNFKVGDKVVVIAGSDKGKEGKIIKTLRSENKVVVEGVNVVKKHQTRSLINWKEGNYEPPKREILK